MQAGLAHSLAKGFLVLTIEHQESPTAGTDQLAAEGSVLPRQLIPFVDFALADECWMKRGMF